MFCELLVVAEYWGKGYTVLKSMGFRLKSSYSKIPAESLAIFFLINLFVASRPQTFSEGPKALCGK